MSDKIKSGDRIEIDNLANAIKSGDEVKIKDKTAGFEFVGKLLLSDRDRDILLSAGLLNYTRKKGK